MYSARREPQGLTTGSNDQFKKRLCKANLSFSARSNQASRKSFALAGGMDRIEKYDSKINPDNPVNPVQINVSYKVLGFRSYVPFS
jgi:hypothetical protein